MSVGAYLGTLECKTMERESYHTRNELCKKGLSQSDYQKGSDCSIYYLQVEDIPSTRIQQLFLLLLLNDHYKQC